MGENAKPKNENDTVNLLRPEFGKTFPNVRTVYINGSFSDSQYPFSLIGFLRLIQSTKWQKVTIKATGPNNWISVLWKASESSIKNEYYSASYDIQCVEKNRKYNAIKSELLIEKY